MWQRQKKPTNWGGCEDAGLVWPRICWMFDNRNATACGDLQDAQERNIQELISNVELGVFCNFEVWKPKKVLNRADRPWRGPSGYSDGLGDEGSEPRNGPGFAWWATQHCVNEALLYEPQIKIEIGWVAGFVPLVLTDDVNWDEAKPH